MILVCQSAEKNVLVDVTLATLTERKLENPYDAEPLALSVHMNESLFLLRFATKVFHRPYYCIVEPF